MKWLGQVTTGHGAMVLAPTVLAVLGGQLTWQAATPLLIAGVVGLLWPENAALKAAAGTVTTDMEQLLTAYRIGLAHASPAQPADNTGTGTAATLKAVTAAAAALTLAVGLSACTGIGGQAVPGQTIGAADQTTAARVVAALCQFDAVAQPVAVAIGPTIVAHVAPGALSDAQLAVQLDAPVHAAIQAACPAGTTLVGAQAAAPPVTQ